MKAQRIKRYLIVILLLGFSGSGGATPYPNPFPGIWSDDVDGKGRFNPGNLTLTVRKSLLCQKNFFRLYRFQANSQKPAISQPRS
jgi:hypothetical protein